jgi:dUTP pyrophosphatase
MKINIKRLNEDAIEPTYATDGSAAFDLYSTNVGVVDGDGYVFDTGWAFEIPEGYVLLIFSRSGHGFKQGIRLANCVGVIDSDYRGEVKVKLTLDRNTLHGEYFTKGDRIAQGMVLPVEQISFFEVDDLSRTERGSGGFGSTG